jgi:DNA helicase II / ATP-dependent DNA helicase PcrA
MFGTGKTRVLTSRIAFLLQEDVRSNILAVTFTRKAANEMKERLEKLLVLVEDTNKKNSPLTYDAEEEEEDSMPEYYYDDYTNQRNPNSGLQRVSVGTFHSICAGILRSNGILLSSLPSVLADMQRSHDPISLDGRFNIIDQGEQVRVIKECLSEHQIDLKLYDLKPNDILQGVSATKHSIHRGNNPFNATNRDQPLTKRQEIALKMYYPYREKLFATNCIDFDDIMYLTRELLSLKSAVRERYQRKWTHILVDEFQDTSQTQLSLVKLLTSTSLLVVGDADQSIYSWRGAHVGSMSDFETDFQPYHPKGVTTVYLMENYRCV